MWRWCSQLHGYVELCCWLSAGDAGTNQRASEARLSSRDDRLHRPGASSSSREKLLLLRLCPGGGSNTWLTLTRSETYSDSLGDSLWDLLWLAQTRSETRSDSLWDSVWLALTRCETRSDSHWLAVRLSLTSDILSLNRSESDLLAHWPPLCLLQQEALPPVQFDWSSSGLTNPLDGRWPPPWPHLLLHSFCL